MTNLKQKALCAMPIGTHAEITYQNPQGPQTVRGILTDSDFCANVEITSYAGEHFILDFSLILGVRQLKDVPQSAPAEPVKKPVAPASAAPEDTLNLSDYDLGLCFQSMPYEEKKLLSGIYESFKYGIRINDSNKTSTAAHQARAVLLREDSTGYEWSREGARFCGALLHRVNVADHQVFLLGECFPEAAVACWKNNDALKAGVFAALSLVEGHGQQDNMRAVLLWAALQLDDASCIVRMLKHPKAQVSGELKDLPQQLLRHKGVALTGGDSREKALQMLPGLFPGKSMDEELARWLLDEEPAPDNSEPETIPPAPPAAPAKPLNGRITRLNWSQNTGTITAEDGQEYAFHYKDLAEDALSGAVRGCLKTDATQEGFWVRFLPRQDAAINIRRETDLVSRARSIMTTPSLENRVKLAWSMCRDAMNTPDRRRALADLVHYGCALFSSGEDPQALSEALSLHEKNPGLYPQTPFPLMNLAQAYAHVRDYNKMTAAADKSIGCPTLTVKQAIGLVSQYLTILREYHAYSGKKEILKRMLQILRDFRQTYGESLRGDSTIRNLYAAHILHHQVRVYCALDMPAEARETLSQLSENSTYRPQLTTLVEALEARHNPVPQPSVPADPLEIPAAPSGGVPEAPSAADADPREVPAVQGQAPVSPDSEPREADTLPAPVPEEEAEETDEEIPPYRDPDGWDALKLTHKDVIDYALGLKGDDRMAALCAYLHTGAVLDQRIAPVYRTVALAANDPLVNPDYSITSLVTALEGSDVDYPVLNDCCMAAAFLRASFLCGRGYDYSTQGLRNSISISRRLTALGDAYDTLESFRKEAGRAMDIYADYRNQDVLKLKEEMDAAIRRAEDLYTKFIQSPPRDNAKFARLVETKRIIFAREGYLATMLRYILDRNQDALDAQRAHFCATFLGGGDTVTGSHISAGAVDNLIAEGWELAGRNMMLKKANATLQGDRRNNLRSNLSDILELIHRWYTLSEQSAGLSWRTEQGEQTYQKLRPQLMQQLQSLEEACACHPDASGNPQLDTGLYLIAATARELRSRLDGSWNVRLRKYFYVDFLRSDQILLNRDFLPDLTSTFCALESFNILHRIRSHAEQPKLGFQEHLDRIFGTDKTCNNYGTADQILEYLDFLGRQDTVTIPEDPQRFRDHSRMQIDMRLRSFRESYALSMNYGQIIKSDTFCHTLEDTVRYWHRKCSDQGNYGFFTRILQQGQNQIHASAREYELQLGEHLDALIAGNQAFFDSHPGYADAIRTQIASQNFTVAEDWMSRIRMGGFTLEIQQPEALGYLENFRRAYESTYNRVADASRTLSALLGRREVHNKDTKHAQLLVDNWLSNGNPSNSQRIRQLLNLLGWQNIQVSQFAFAPEPRGEFYRVSSRIDTSALVAPKHPIAAFGSDLYSKSMYVVCLYGNYNCDRLYEKMRTLDAIDGSKIFLLDYALSHADRRALARKLKLRENGLRNVSMVIDRVLITHLANNYNENLINRMLMATAMPYSYCQPYVVESVHTMPPEIFIGRKEELLKIEEAGGVNLIFGGRQLGKSALFKKALSDIDNRGDCRAALVDIKELSCADAARKISTKLIDLGITPDAEITSDWDVLCRNIERRLRSKENEIPYFLLMLDEADAFINDCAGCAYRPLVALKDVQQSLPGKFKYVLAGLHNIVKFNRQVALGNNSVITHMPSLKITPFRTPEAQELLTHPLSYLGFSLPSKVTISQILATCNYFPGLIQLYARKLIESIRASDYAGYDVRNTPPYVVSDEHLRRVMSDKEFVEQINEKFEITLTLDQDQGSCYYPLTLLIGWMYSVAPSKSGYTARDVLTHARDLGIEPLARLDEEKIDALLQELQDLNILRGVSGSSYLLASKNFRDLLGSDEEIFEKLTRIGGEAQ